MLATPRCVCTLRNILLFPSQEVVASRTHVSCPHARTHTPHPFTIYLRTFVACLFSLCACEQEEIGRLQKLDWDEKENLITKLTEEKEQLLAKKEEQLDLIKRKKEAKAKGLPMPILDTPLLAAYDTIATENVNHFLICGIYLSACSCCGAVSCVQKKLLVAIVVCLFCVICLCTH